MHFEWDPAKAAANLLKHGISFEDAKAAFYDPNRSTRADRRHDYGEDRHNTIGVAAAGAAVLLTVTWTPRGSAIRIISARKANRNEERHYRSLRI